MYRVNRGGVEMEKATKVSPSHSIIYEV